MNNTELRQELAWAHRHYDAAGNVVEQVTLPVADVKRLLDTVDRVEELSEEWLDTSDIHLHLAGARLADTVEPGRCTGAGSCRAEFHAHGCFADRGNCDDPQEHQ